MLCKADVRRPVSLLSPHNPSLPSRVHLLHSKLLRRRSGRSLRSSIRNEIVIGIDLGTTNSAVAAMQDGVPKILRVDNDHPTMPSVVHYNASRDVTVGRKAVRLQSKDPANTFHSVKRFIGQKLEVVRKEADNMAYTVEADEDGFAAIKCPIVGASLLPEEISAHVLSKLIEDTERIIQQQIKKAVVTVPAYFDDEQREATRTAGLAAGLEVVKLLREPQAAAIAYGLNLKEDSIVLVFDLGGGTFDVSILMVGGGTIEVLSTGGDANLGGNDFDAAIMQHIREEAKQAGYAFPTHDKAQHSLMALARKAKEDLTNNTRTTVKLPIGGGKFWETTITRKKLEGLSSKLINRMRMPVEIAADRAGVDLSSAQLAARGKGRGRRSTGLVVDEVLLVGGATRMPAVRRFVQNMTGVAPKVTAVDPDEVVALGAAVQAGILEGTVTDLAVFDNWQATLMRALAQARMNEDGVIELKPDAESRQQRNKRYNE